MRSHKVDAFPLATAADATLTSRQRAREEGTGVLGMAAERPEGVLLPEGWWEGGGQLGSPRVGGQSVKGRHRLQSGSKPGMGMGSKGAWE